MLSDPSSLAKLINFKLTHTAPPTFNKISENQGFIKSQLTDLKC